MENQLTSSQISSLKTIKCLKQKYRFTDKKLFDDFRWMVNEAIRVGIETKITSKFALRNLLYTRFKNDYNTYFISMAVFKAHAILKNYRRRIRNNIPTKKPYVKKRFIIIDSMYVKLTGEYIHFSIKPKQFIAIKMNQYILNLSQN